MGQSPPGSSYNEQGNGLPFIQGSAEFGTRNPSPVKYCTDPRKVAQVGDLLLSVRAPVGDRNFADQETAIGRGLAIIRGAADLATTEFLALAIEHRLPDLLARSGGGMFTSVTKAGLADLPVAVPPLAEQRRIVDLMDAVDQTIASAHVDASAATACYSTLVGGLGEGHDAVGLTQVLAVAKAGGTPNRKEPAFFGGPIPWLKSGEVNSPEISITEESISEAGLASSSAWLVPEDSVVVAMYGATAGMVGYLRSPMATNQAVIALRPKPDLMSARFLFHVLRSRTVHMKARATGAAQPNLSKDRVLEEAVPSLSLDDQARWVGVLDDLLTVASSANELASRLTEMRSALLGDLLAGAKEIPESYDSLLEPV